MPDIFLFLFNIFSSNFSISVCNNSRISYIKIYILFIINYSWISHAKINVVIHSPWISHGKIDIVIKKSSICYIINYLWINYFKINVISFRFFNIFLAPKFLYFSVIFLAAIWALLFCLRSLYLLNRWYLQDHYYCLQ